MTQDLQGLLDRVRQGDYSAQADAAAAGAAAVPGLTALAHDPSEEVRQLAVYCLIETRAPAAAAGLAEALFDEDPQVAMAAAKGLEPLASPAQVPQLLLAWDRAAEPLVRRQIALVVGLVAGAGDVGELKKRWGGEADPVAREGATAALARLGDDEARDAFAKALLGSSGQDRRRYLELSEWIGQTWLLPVLAKVLDDPTDLVRVAVDARPDLIQALRACDLALIAIAHIGGARFSFTIVPAHNFTPAELDEARAFVKAQTP